MSGNHLYPLFYNFETIRDGWYNVYGDRDGSQYRGAFLFVDRQEAVHMGQGSSNILYRIRVRVKHG